MSEFDLCSLLFPPDLPPVYTFSPIALGYKAGPSPPEAQLAEHPLAEDEPAGPESKSLSHQCHVKPLTVEEEMRKGEEDCKVKSREEAKGCSDSGTKSQISGLLPCPWQAPVPDLVDLSLGCSGQKKGLEEPQVSKEHGADGDHGKVDMEEIDMEPEPAECTVSVPVEPEEEAVEQDGESVEVVEDIKMKEDRNGKSLDEDLELLPVCPSPAHSQSADPMLPATSATSAAVQLEGAYMWSLELLIAAALCATRDALYPPVPVDQAPCPSSHHGMEMLGELAELEIQQRSRKSKGKDNKGKNNFQN